MSKHIKRLIIALVAIPVVFIIAYRYDLYVWKTAPQSLWITGGKLFDGVSQQAKENPGILIDDGTIMCIGKSCDIPENIVTVDASGKSIIPGLIELHGHFYASGKQRRRNDILPMMWDSIRFKPEVRRKLVESGITSYRSVGDHSDGIFKLKEQSDKGNIAGPRMYVCGPIFTAPGGHPADKIPESLIDQMVVQSNDPDFVKNKAQSLAERGADGIKVVYQRGSAEQGMSLKTLTSLVEEAQNLDMWVAVHTGSPSETLDVINLGVSTIEHGIRHGNLIDEQTLNEIVAKDIVYVPTLGREPKGHLNIPALYNAKVKFGVGTDTQGDMIVGDSYHNELQNMVNAGIADVDVLIAATRNGAEALGKQQQLGTLEVGKLADLLIVNGQPWNDINTLKNIDMVVLGGRVAIKN